MNIFYKNKQVNRLKRQLTVQGAFVYRFEFSNLIGLTEQVWLLEVFIQIPKYKENG
jgi:hypothetical protein